MESETRFVDLELPPALRDRGVSFLTEDQRWELALLAFQRHPLELGQVCRRLRAGAMDADDLLQSVCVRFACETLGHSLGPTTLLRAFSRMLASVARDERRRLRRELPLLDQGEACSPSFETHALLLAEAALMATRGERTLAGWWSTLSPAQRIAALDGVRGVPATTTARRHRMSVGTIYVRRSEAWRRLRPRDRALLRAWRAVLALGVPLTIVEGWARTRGEPDPEERLPDV